MTARPLLELRGLDVRYGGIRALQAIDLTVHEGEVVTLLGSNGAGKSTTLRSVSRLIDAHAGRIAYDGRDVTRIRADEIVRLGVAHVPEGRRMLTRLTVLDNLLLGAYARSDHRQIRADVDRQLERFPRLPIGVISWRGRSPEASSRCSRSRAA